MMISFILVLVVFCTIATYVEALNSTLHEVEKCPEEEDWTTKSAQFCGVEHGFMYHCSYTMNCTLVETCIEPQKSYVVRGVFLLDFYNDTVIFHQEFLPIRADPTNSSLYWKIIGSVYCKKDSNRQPIRSSTNADDYSARFIIVIVVLPVIISILIIVIIVLCVKLREKYRPAETAIDL